MLTRSAGRVLLALGAPGAGRVWDMIWMSGATSHSYWRSRRDRSRRHGWHRASQRSARRRRPFRPPSGRRRDSGRLGRTTRLACRRGDWARNGSPIGLMNGAQACPVTEIGGSAPVRPRRGNASNMSGKEHERSPGWRRHIRCTRERQMKGPLLNLPGARGPPYARCGSRRTALSPTWSDPEGSSHNDFVPGRRLPPFPALRAQLPPSAGGGAMTEFEFLFSVFGLLIGLTLIEIAIKFADAIDAHPRRPIGVLTPLLAAVRPDRCRGLLAVQLVFARSASRPLADRFHRADRGDDLLFVRIDDLSAQRGQWKTLDEHYWARKRLVIGGVLLVESATMAWQLTRAVPALDDYWFWFYQLPYFMPDGRAAVHPFAARRHRAFCDSDRSSALLGLRSWGELAMGS